MLFLHQLAIKHFNENAIFCPTPMADRVYNAFLSHFWFKNQLFTVPHFALSLKNIEISHAFSVPFSLHKSEIYLPFRLSKNHLSRRKYYLCHFDNYIQAK